MCSWRVLEMDPLFRNGALASGTQKMVDAKLKFTASSPYIECVALLLLSMLARCDSITVRA